LGWKSPEKKNKKKTNPGEDQKKKKKKKLMNDEAKSYKIIILDNCLVFLESANKHRFLLGLLLEGNASHVLSHKNHKETLRSQTFASMHLMNKHLAPKDSR